MLQNSLRALLTEPKKNIENSKLKKKKKKILYNFNKIR